MEQRPLRLGDIVDDYCPRERRITNHTIVALVGDDIRQTRCSTCDGEHVYKDGKEPRRRKKDGDDKGADGAGGQLIPARGPSSESEPPQPVAASAHEAETTAGAEPSSLAEEPPAEAGSWFGHRRLIRATLPRTEGDLPAPRPIPEFTMHQRPQSRGGRGFRDPQQGGGWSGGGGGRSNGDGNGFRHGRQGPGNGNGSGSSFDGRGGQGKSGHHRSRHKRPR